MLISRIWHFLTTFCTLSTYVLGFQFFIKFYFPHLEPGVGDVLPCYFCGPLGPFIHGENSLKNPRYI